MYFLLICCFLSNRILSQTLCKDLFLEDIIINGELSNKAFFYDLCATINGNSINANKAINEYIEKGEFENNYEKVFCYLFHSVTLQEFGRSSEKYVSIKKAYNLSSEIEDPLLRVITIGTYAGNLREYNVSQNIVLDLFNEALDIAEKLPAKYNSMRFFLLNEIGKIHLKNEDYIQSINYFIMARDHIKSSNDIILLSSGNNNIGYGYLKKKDYKKALEYFEKSLSILDVSNPIHLEFKANVYENFGHVYSDLNNRDKAIEYYKEAGNISRRVNSKVLEIRTNLAMILLFDDSSKGNKIPEEIEQMIISVRTYFKKNKNEIVSIHYNGLPERFYKFLVERSQQNHPDNSNISFEDAWKDYQEYIIAFHNTKTSNTVTEDYVNMMNSYYDQVISKEKNEKKVAVQKQLGIIMMLILIILFIITLLRNRILKLEAIKGKNKVVEIENSMMEQRLEFKNEDIINLSTQLSMMLDLKKSIVEKITVLSEKEVTKESLKKLLQDLKIETSIEDRLLVLKSDITKLNSQFLSALMNRYPSLSKTEREICSLIRLNLSTKEIAMIRNTSVNAVKMNRSRIRKKMQLDKNEELDRYIARIK